MTELEIVRDLYSKYGIKDLKSLTLEKFRELEFILEGESKEIRKLSDDYCIIYFKPTIYSFTSNRTGVVEGSNIPRVQCSQVLCEVLKSHGIDHAYVDYGNEFVAARYIKNAPNIEVVVKANHTGTSKHRYFGMNGSKVRSNHPYYAGMEIKDMEPYPEAIVRFDWRNPFWEPSTKKMLADEVLGDQQADFFIDVKEARKTAAKTFSILSDFLSEHDIVCYDLCLFISEDGKTVYGELSPDCGRFRHYDLGSLDKDVWRAGGSSEQVIEKWNLLHKMICEK